VFQRDLPGEALVPEEILSLLAGGNQLRLEKEDHMLRSITTRTAGLAIVILAIWGGVIPFVGPYFHFTLGPDQTWTWTTARLYLSVLPAIGALVGGLWLMGAGPWASGRVGALLALASGIWFAVGPDLSYLWHTGGQLGAAHGTLTRQAMERLGLHTGLGVVIAALAAFALPSAVGWTRRKEAVPATEPGYPAAAAHPATDGAPGAAAEPGTAAEPAPVGVGATSDSGTPAEHVGV
jgi:hypothetical protein